MRGKKRLSKITVKMKWFESLCLGVLTMIDILQRTTSTVLHADP